MAKDRNRCKQQALQLLALQLLGVNGFALDSNDLFSDGEIASSRAPGGTLDALLMVAGAQSPVLQALLACARIGPST